MPSLKANFSHPSARRRRKPVPAKVAMQVAVARRFPHGTKHAQQERAYHDGQGLALALLDYIVKAQRGDTPWNPEHGPDPSWAFSRGVLDILLPALDDTKRLMGTRAGQKFAAALRQCLLDDLRYHAASALDLARSEPPRFTPYSEEW